MTFLKTTIRDEDDHYYKKISWLPGWGIMSFFRVKFVIVGCGRCGKRKGRMGKRERRLWRKGSWLPLFSLPPPSLALFTSPTQAFVAIVDKIYTWIFQSYSMFGIQKNSSSISHHEHILPKYQNFFILIGNYMYVYIQFITQITKLFASWVFLWPELKVDKKASVSFSLD